MMHLNDLFILYVFATMLQIYSSDSKNTSLLQKIHRFLPHFDHGTYLLNGHILKTGIINTWWQP